MIPSVRHTAVPIPPAAPPRARAGPGDGRRRSAVLAGILLWGLLWGCAALRPSEAPLFESETVRRRYESLRSANPGLSTLRGVGAVDVRVPGRPPLDARAAFVLEPGGRVRLTVRAVTGQPLLTLSFDGERLHLLDHTRRKSTRKRQGADLSDLVGVPIRLEELTSLLVGRLPAMPLERARGDGTPEGILLQEHRWGGVAYRASADGPEGSLARLERLDRDGDTVWRAELSDYRIVEAYRVPARVRVEAANGSLVALHIERFIVDRPVDGAVFTLQPLS